MGSDPTIRRGLGPEASSARPGVFGTLDPMLGLDLLVNQKSSDLWMFIPKKYSVIMCDIGLKLFLSHPQIGTSGY